MGLVWGLFLRPARMNPNPTLFVLAMRHTHDFVWDVLAVLNAAHRRTTMKKRIALCIAAGCALAASILQAQTWPQRPVKVVVPFAAGGSTDSQARIVSDRLSAAFGQQFL